jgi:site-specific recombinase XerD
MQADFNGFLQQMHKSTSTINVYSSILNKIKRTYPEVTGYNYRDVIALLGKLNLSGNQTSHAQTTLTVLKHYYHFLIASGERNNHPCSTLHLKANGSKGLIQADLFTNNELELLLKRKERYDVLELRNKVLFSLLIFQGLASHEIVGLRISDIALGDNFIQIRKSHKLNRRRLAINTEQIDWLKEYLDKVRPKLIKKKTDALLIGKTGTSITVDSIHYLVSTQQPLFPFKELTASRIRQSVIAFWLNNLNIPIEQVQLLAGHKWISSTEKYKFHSFADDMKVLMRVHPMK